MHPDDEVSRLPIIRMWGVVLVALQGEITDHMASRLRRQVLEVIHDEGAEGLILDVTGVWMMDSHLCSVLSNIAAAAELMGTETVISGMSPEIAQTLQTMGVEFSDTRTALTVEQAMGLLGLTVVMTNGDDDGYESQARTEPNGSVDAKD